jgi:GNAT superfamily N-acetyltransferase
MRSRLTGDGVADKLDASAMRTRLASPEDAAALAALTNLAYRVEDFFKIGDRTDSADVRARMKDGAFLVLEDAAGTIVGSVYVTRHGKTGYFGMLAIDPARQGQGFAARLIAAAEAHCGAQGCTEMELEVVNLRTELPPFYRRFGYVESSTRPFIDADKTSRPCHSIVMTKSLMI